MNLMTQKKDPELKLNEYWKSLAIACVEKDHATAQRCVWALKYYKGLLDNKVKEELASGKDDLGLEYVDENQYSDIIK